MPITLSLAEAIRRYALDQVLGQSVSSCVDDEALRTAQVWVFEQTDVLEGDLLLNDLVAEDVVGVVALGSLSVMGSVADFESDALAAFLYVKGDLRAANLICGCAEIVVEGATWVDHLVMGYYNHGHMALHGDVHARLLAVDDHWTELGGEVFAATLGAGDALPHWDYQHWRDVLAPAAAVELLRQDGRWKHGDYVHLIGALVGGDQVLRSELRRR